MRLSLYRCFLKLGWFLPDSRPHLNASKQGESGSCVSEFDMWQFATGEERRLTRERISETAIRRRYVHELIDDQVISQINSTGANVRCG